MNPKTLPREDPLSVTSRVKVAIDASRGGRFARDTLRGVRAVVHGFRGERISLRAAALTYVSIFSLVPLLTVALVLIQSLKQTEFQERLLVFVHDVFAPGIRDESAEFLKRFVDRASSFTAGSIGFVMLLISGGTLIKNLDASLNEIWRVRRKRPWHLRLLYYTGILIVGPLLVVLSLVGSAVLRSLAAQAHFPHWRELFSLGTWFVAIFFFTLVYFVAPNAPVRFRSAFAGGCVAGTGWEIARHGYAVFGARIFEVNPVFGSLGEAPLFLAWIYLCWLLALFGARLAYAVEYASFQGAFRALGDHPRAKELVATQMAQLITLAQVEGEPAPAPRELARKLEVPIDTVLEIAEQLAISRLIVVGRRGGLYPARHPDQLTVAELSAAVGGVISLLSSVGGDNEEPPREFRHLEALFRQIDRATVAKLGKVTWSSLILPELQRADGPVERAARIRKRAGTRNP